MSRRRYQRNRHEVPEINITAFLNLMVVLIPFLLLTAAFNQLTVLDLYLPTIGAADEEQVRDKRPELEVTVRTDTLVISDRKKGPYLSLEANDGSFDYSAMQNKLLEIKSKYQELTQITLLSEPDIAYNQIIEVMDRVRQTRVTANGTRLNVELFPDIALGDAPPIKGAKQK
ncbi:MAG: biopolymer transporter ExbD [Halopseudomonas sp.]